MNSDDGSRTARVTRDADGRALGVAVFISAAELTALGVDPETATRVAYAICHQQLAITAASTGGDNE